MIGVFDRDPVSGTLKKKSGSAGCVSDHGPKGMCIEARYLTEANGIAVSPDGRNIYVGNYTGGSMAVFDRDPATGILSQKGGSAGCFTEDGSGGCSRGRGFAGGFSLSVSPDGKNLYVSSLNSSGVAVFTRRVEE